MNSDESKENGGGGCILCIVLTIGMWACASVILEDTEDREDSIDGGVENSQEPGDGSSGISGSSREYLSGQSNGYDWARVSISTRMSFCRNLSENFKREGLSNRPADWFYDAFNSFYGTSETDSTTLSEAAALFVTAD